MSFNIKALGNQEFNQFLATFHEEVCEKDAEGEEFVRPFSDFEFALIEDELEEDEIEEDTERTYHLEFDAKPEGCWNGFKRWLGIKEESRQLTAVATFAADFFEAHKGFIQTKESLQHVTDILGRFETLTEESQKRITGPLGRFERLIADVIEKQASNLKAQEDAAEVNALSAKVKQLDTQVIQLKTGLEERHIEQLRINNEQLITDQVTQRTEERRLQLNAQEAQIGEKLELMSRISSRAQASFAETPLEPEQKEVSEQTEDLQKRAKRIVLELASDQLKGIEQREKEIARIREQAEQEAQQFLEGARDKMQQVEAREHRINFLEQDIIRVARDHERRIIKEAEDKAKELEARLTEELTEKITTFVIADFARKNEQLIRKLRAAGESDAKETKDAAERLRKEREGFLTGATDIARISFPAFQPAFQLLNSQYDVQIICKDGEVLTHRCVIESLDVIKKAAQFKKRGGILTSSTKEIEQLREKNSLGQQEEERKKKRESETSFLQMEQKIASSLSLDETETDPKTEADRKLNSSSILVKDHDTYKFRDIPKIVMQDFLDVVMNGGVIAKTYSFISLRWLYCLATHLGEKKLIKGFGRALEESLGNSQVLLAIAIKDLLEADPASPLGDTSLWSIYCACFKSDECIKRFVTNCSYFVFVPHNATGPACISFSELLKNYASQEIANAIVALGHHHRSIYGLPMSEEIAFECYLKAASSPHNNAIAAVHVAAHLLHGIGVERNIQKAKQWCETALHYDSSCAAANSVLAETYLVLNEREKAVALYIKAANQGCSVSRDHLREHHRATFDILLA